jgi:pyrroline-5-carboxylate reductase
MLGSAILKALLAGHECLPSREGKESQSSALPARFVACVRSQESAEKLRTTLSDRLSQVTVLCGDLLETARRSDILILGCKPHMAEALLKTPTLDTALQDKLLISIVAGWTRAQLQSTLYGIGTVTPRCSVARVMPNIAASVAESMTAIEESDPPLPQEHTSIVRSIFEQVGKTAFLPPHLMDASTALSGSTPAYFAIVCEALIDGGVALGLTRLVAQRMAYQSLLGTAKLLEQGMDLASLKGDVTSPGGCTIRSLVGLEKSGIRGHFAEALMVSASVASSLQDPK